MAQVNNPKGINQYTKGGRAKAGTLPRSTYSVSQSNAFQGPPVPFTSTAGAGRGNLNPPNVDRFSSASKTGMALGVKAENAIRSAGAAAKAIKASGAMERASMRIRASQSDDNSLKTKVRIVKEETSRAVGEARRAMNRSSVSSADQDPMSTTGGRMGARAGRTLASAKEDLGIAKESAKDKIKATAKSIKGKASNLASKIRAK